MTRLLCIEAGIPCNDISKGEKSPLRFNKIYHSDSSYFKQDQEYYFLIELGEEYAFHHSLFLLLSDGDVPEVVIASSGK